MVALLSDPSHFVGGVSCFEGESAERQVQLKRGDAVFFRGEACEHWITPVTSGQRLILQIEISRCHDLRDLSLLWLGSFVFAIFCSLTFLTGGDDWLSLSISYMLVLLFA